jgi:hypothetical protein
MELWGIELTYRGRKLTVLDLESPTKAGDTKPPQPVQLQLWDSIKALKNEALSIRVEKKGPQSITLQVEVSFKTG